MKVAITIGDRTYTLVFGKGSVVALLLAVFLISETAWAQYTAFGAAQASCGHWTVGRDGSEPTGWNQWLHGYLTAYSQWVEKGSGPVTFGDDLGPRAWLDNYCRDNPLEKVGNAARQLIHAIKAK